MTRDESVSPPGFAWMDFSRAAAALLVAASHIRDLLLVDFDGGSVLYKGLYFITGYGHIGVIVFFVLSGYWITKSVMGRIQQDAFWRHYLIDRVARLSIVLVPVLAIGFVIDTYAVHALGLPLHLGQTGAHSVASDVPERLTLLTYLGNALFLQELLVPTAGSNGPLWSLAYEFWFYVWFPAIAISIVKRRFSLALVFLALGLLNPSFYLGFIAWLFGTALYFAARYRAPERMGARLRIAGLVLCGGLAFGATAVARVMPLPILDPVLAAAFALFLYFVLAIRTPMPRLIQPVASFGANSSFSLYALHFPLAALVAGLLTRGGRLPSDPLHWGMVFGLLAILAGIALVFSRFTEARTGSLRRWLRKVTARAGDTQGGAAA